MRRASDRRRRAFLPGVRLALGLGFGGLLALLAIAGYSSLRTLQRVDRIDSESTGLFVRRDDALEAVRASAYSLSSQIRNYLLDPDASAIPTHRGRAQYNWDATGEALKRYRQVATPQAAQPVDRLTRELSEYWSQASEALAWSEARRQNEGYRLLADRLGPLRDRFLASLDEIRLLDQQDHRQVIARASHLIDELQGRLVLTVAVILGLGLILAGTSLYFLVHYQNTAHEQFEALLQAHAELEQLSRKVLDIQEEERRSIARELHDEIGQSLGVLLVDIGQARSSAHEKAPDSATYLDDAKRLAESTLASVRNLCLLLRPSMLDDLGLVPALHWQARETTRRQGIEVEVLADDADMELPDALRTAVYRVVQEALRNAVRHAEARTVRIMVRKDERRLLVVVQDDGKGFDPRSQRGLGLLGMQERACHLGGTLRIESAPGQGAVLQMELPLAGGERND